MFGFLQASSASAPISEDVKELLYLANYHANKRYKRALKNLAGPEAAYDLKPSTSAADVWLATSELARLFAPLQVLLSGLSVKPARIKSAALSFLEPQPLLEAGPDVAETLMNQWQQAHEARLAQGLPSYRVDMVDALLSLWTITEHPLQESLIALGITPQAIQASHAALEKPALPGVSKNNAFRSLFLLREAVEMVLVVIISLVVIKEGFGELRLIPSESMVPTLLVGDRLVIEKVTRWTREPQRGDIVVFYPPEPDAVMNMDPLSVFLRMTGFSSLFHNKADDPVDKAFIKRLIGEPGDTIQVVNSIGVAINGKLLVEPYTAERGSDCGMLCYPAKVPEGHYLMMGDNRNMSKDGRYFGFVPKDRLVGRAVFRLWPLDRVGPLR
ncbi:MAG: signal peptidase I [Vampirovibrionales bacterium]|nr:signal peptidase I [Vampirovibrionales bacterium]